MNREFLSEVHRLEEGLEGQKFENEQLRQKVLMKPSALGVEVRGAYKTSSAR